MKIDMHEISVKNIFEGYKDLSNEEGGVFALNGNLTCRPAYQREFVYKEVARMKPKEIFADAVTASSTSILIGDLVKLIRQNGVEIGQKRLFAWLRSNGYLMQTGSSRNLPTQRSMEMGLFEIKESTVINPDGSIRATKTTKVKGKGHVYFVNKFLSGEVDIMD